MKSLTVTLIFFVFLVNNNLFGQACSLPGTIPSTAIPVCGTTPFRQELVIDCVGPDIAKRDCDSTFKSSRSFWYKFTCFQTGTFGFLINGISPIDDYDWVIFDITGRNVNEVYTNPSLQVSLNMYGLHPQDTGPFPNSPTGTIAQGSGDVHCEGAAATNSPFNRMPTLIKDHNYLLLVANYSESLQGYTLSFTGGTASITDPLLPRLSQASARCDGMQIRVKLNKKMKCSTLATNGSDFRINVPGISVTAATGIGCNNGFDMDSVLLTLNAPLTPGNYVLSTVNGSDANTLLDYCDRAIPVNDNIPLRILPIFPTAMDSLTKPACEPQSLQLVFSRPINCSSIAANGSDFTITGPSTVSITEASGNCSSGFSNNITVQLASPIQRGGTYRITLGNGSDGNTLIDECNLQTPAGSFIDFIVADTVNANFTYSIAYGCAQNTIQYVHPGANGVNSWQWNFDAAQTSNQQNPLISYTNYRQKNTRLVVSNGVCRDTSSTTIYFDNFMEAAFEGPQFVCPDEAVIFVNQSEGNITRYEWSFANGTTSSIRNPPPQTYPVPLATRDEIVRLITRNSYGCADTATQKIKVVNNCYIAVPSAFTPNNDGLNDFLYPLNAYKALDLTFSVYNRFGQRLFFTRNWLDKWDGTFKGQGADPGTYVWILQYTHLDTGQKVEQKGTVILIR